MNRFTPFLENEPPRDDRFYQGMMVGAIGTALLISAVVGLNFFIF